QRHSCAGVAPLSPIRRWCRSGKDPIPVVWAALDRSWYNFLQAKVTKRYSHGLTIASAFTWSKSESNPGGTVNNVFNRSVNKSITAFDQPFIFNIGYTYEIPKFGQNKLLQAVVSAWTIGGLLE